MQVKNFNSKNKELGDGQNLFSASTSHFIYLFDKYNVNSCLILDIVRVFNEHETRKERDANSLGRIQKMQWENIVGFW